MINSGLNLGQVITLLSKRPGDHLCAFDFGGTRPAGVGSYRGFYEDLAIGFEEDNSATVAEVLATLKAAIGETFHGWKGGEYRMKESSTVWVANRGNTSDTFIKGLRDCDYMTIIETDWEAS